MAEQGNTEATAPAAKKPPAITVRCNTQAEYDWITQAATKREMSRGEFLLAGALQRRTGGPMPQGRKVKEAAARAGVQTSAEAKANVKPIPRRAAN